MSKYEVLYIISPSVAEGERDAVIEKFKSYVEKNGGTVIGIDKWGLKRLSYEIKFKHEGFYVLMNFEAQGELSADLQKLMNITDEILRSIVVKK